MRAVLLLARERIRIRNQSFQVIGVMEQKGSGQFGQDQNDTIFTPYATVQKKPPSST